SRQALRWLREKKPQPITPTAIRSIMVSPASDQLALPAERMQLQHRPLHKAFLAALGQDILDASGLCRPDTRRVALSGRGCWHRSAEPNAAVQRWPASVSSHGRYSAAWSPSALAMPG